MHSKTNRSIISVIIAAFMMLSAVMFSYRPNHESYAKEDYTKWKQTDPRWSSSDMGGETLGSSGCLITSLAMMAMHSGSIDSAAAKNMGISSADQFDPGVLCRAYRERNGLLYGCIANWNMINDIIPSVTFVRDSHLTSTTRSGIVSEVKSFLDSGMHVILNVNGYHWVYIYAANGNDLYMMDPAPYKSASVFNEYGVYGNNEYWVLKGAKTPAKSGGLLVDAVKKDIAPRQTTAATTTTQKVTTTTTTTNTTTTTTTTTVTTTAATTATGTAIDPVEYSYNGDSEVPVYDSVKDKPSDYSLNSGESVFIYAVYNEYGRIATSDGKGLGWVDISELTPVSPDTSRLKGDIDGNGTVDKYDLALLNEYLKKRSELPDGISSLRTSELKAADVNGDDTVDSGDVTELLKLLFPKE